MTGQIWRNEAKDKPVLCNASGSRYKKWGSLENYRPKCFKSKCHNNLTNFKGRSNLDIKDKPLSYVPDSGKKNPSLWNFKIPTKKRSRVVYKQMTQMEMFQKQLLNLWRYHWKQNESSPEDDLSFHNVNNFIPSNEIGHGCIRLEPDGTST
ncbi:uncharacterized protein LOC133309048 [Gastrolobium bilobum]|uniref:uncharacterized protein LOC133309048 n=1 Tax=Gastrolobium bilobum TaxID=150636 RepID=UPI002AB137F9|nr:uncharacterized protein LOC133309048 [Gastrolobium bilobum]